VNQGNKTFQNIARK